MWICIDRMWVRIQAGCKTRKSQKKFKTYMFSKSQKYLRFRFRLENIISCIIRRAFLFLFLRERNFFLVNLMIFFLFLYPWIRIYGPKWMLIRPDLVPDPHPWLYLLVCIIYHAHSDLLFLLSSTQQTINKSKSSWIRGNAICVSLFSSEATL